MLGLALALVGATALVLVVGYVRAHPKPDQEPLEQYVEEVASGVEQEVKDEAVIVVDEVKAVVKRVRKPKSTT